MPSARSDQGAAVRSHRVYESRSTFFFYRGHNAIVSKSVRSSVRASVVSLSFIFPHPPEDKNTKRNPAQPPLLYYDTRASCTFIIRTAMWVISGRKVIAELGRRHPLFSLAVW